MRKRVTGTKVCHSGDEITHKQCFTANVDNFHFICSNLQVNSSQPVILTCEPTQILCALLGLTYCYDPNLSRLCIRCLLAMATY